MHLIISNAALSNQETDGKIDFNNPDSGIIINGVSRLI